MTRRGGSTDAFLVNSCHHVMSLTAGTRFGPYEILGAIGAGGMGEVYRARDARLGRDVAIKVLPASLSTDDDRLRRFEQEARSTAALNHPNILAVYDVGSHDGTPYVVYELLEGGTLRERLPTGSTSTRKAVELAVQIARGLAAAHERNIVHRDLKPENVFVTNDGRVKILDFGLAKLVEPDLPSRSHDARSTTINLDTTPGTVLGTVGYMSPEQVRGLPVDARTDIFALGIVLYEMLSGRRPFYGETPADTIAAIVKEEPADLSGVDRNIPAALERIVDRCLEKTPSARFQTASDLGFALEGLSSPSDRVEAVKQPKVARGSGASARMAWPLAAGSLLAFAAAGFVVVQHLREDTAPVEVARFEVSAPANTLILGNAPPVISPDGRHLAFGAIEDGIAALWIRRLSDVTAERLPGTNGAVHPFWSPDSRSLAFFADGKLKRLTLNGGPPVVVCDAPPGGGGAWAPDNTMVFAPGPNAPLSRVPSSGGKPEVVTTLADGELGHRWPSFLPDGRHFLFAISLGAGQTGGGLALGALDATDRALIEGAANSNAVYGAGHLLFVRAGNLVALPFDPVARRVTGEAWPVATPVVAFAGSLRAPLSVSETGTLVYRAGRPQVTTLTWFDRAGKVMGTIEDAAAHINLALSPDERRLAVSRTPQGAPVPNIDIWILDLTRGGVPSRLTFAPDGEFDPEWSADGSAVLFTSARDRTFDLFRHAANGTGEDTLLLKSPAGAYGPRSSPDGKYIAYFSATDIWLLPSGGGEPRRFTETPFNESVPAFSPDGKWLAYASNESGRAEILVQPFPSGGGRYQISRAGGTVPSWRGDSRELFYLAPGGTMMSVGIEASKDFQAAAPRPLFETGIVSTQNNQPYVVSRDGQRFLVPVPDRSANAPMTVVLNWVAARSE